MVTRITSQNVKDYSLLVQDLADFAVSDGGGLTANYQAGAYRNKNQVTQLSAGSLVLDDDATNFIEIDDFGGISFNTSDFSLHGIPLFIVTTSSGAIDAIVDFRTWLLVDNYPPQFVDNEIPAGTIDGINDTFLLDFAPDPPTSIHLYKNGIRQQLV